MGGYVSLVARQRNESCNAKEFLQSRTRMVALFEDIALYSKEMLENRVLRNKVPLEAVLLFIQNRRDDFITINFIPSNINGSSLSTLVLACFYYSTKGEGDNKWCQHKKQNKSKQDAINFDVFTKLMTALFYFSHLYDLFIGADDNVNDEKILIGEFLRAKDKLLSMPGMILKNDPDEPPLTLEIWKNEFHKMDAMVSSNQYVSFHEFCQYAVRELITPEEYLEQYEKMAYDPKRPVFPPRYDRTMNYSACVAQCILDMKQKEKDKEDAKKAKLKQFQTEQRAVKQKPLLSELTEKYKEKEPESKTRPRLKSKSMISSKPNTCTSSQAVSRPTIYQVKKSEEETRDINSFSRSRKDSDNIPHDDGSSQGGNSISILLTSRGRIRPVSAPPPQCLDGISFDEVPPGYTLLRPTVFNGRDILSTKKAMKKKYNTFHDYKLDPNMKSNFIPTNIPKKHPQHRKVPKRLLAPTSHSFGDKPSTTPTSVSKNEHFNGSFLGSCYSTLEGSRTTLHLQVPLQSVNNISLIEGDIEENQPSVCVTAAGDSVTMCDLSLNHA